MDIRPLTDTEVEPLLAATPLHPLLQTDAWAEFQASYGRGVVRFAAIEQGVIVGAVTLIEHQIQLGASYLYIPHGPVATTNEAALALLNAAVEHGKKRGVMYIKVDPPLEAQWELPSIFTPGTSLQPRNTAILDLRRPEEGILAGMHQKTRYNIRLAEKKGVTVRWSSSDADFENFLLLQRTMSERQGIHLHSDTYYRSMFEVFRKRDMVQLAIAEFNGQPLAINEIVVHGTVGTFLHGGSTDSMKELMAPALLQWETIRALQQRGCEWYDFRGIAPADQPQHHLAGVTRFKMGFGGVERVYPVAGNAVLQPAMYWAYRFAKRIRGSRGD